MTATVLDFEKKHDLSYCVDTWVRDEQIKLACRRPGVGRIQPGAEKRTEPIAVVCFGPSLNDTWEKVREFKYIVTCSGSHRFLIDRGIIPTWHVEVDPRPHKVKLLGAPHPDVEYFIASACAPAVFDHLKGFNVKLWHVFDSKEDGFRILPYGEWALTGGPDVGMRAMGIARFLGFTDLHIFGMDGSFPDAAHSHATEHPNKRPAQETVYRGKTYQTTIAMMECAKAVWHELDEMPDVVPTFYGDGLIQDMSKHYERKPPKNGLTLAANKEPLISEEYRALNAQLHTENIAYGVGGGKYANTVTKLCESIGTHSVLDYGCGKGYLGKALDFPIWEYDPAIPEKAAAPRPADIVICTDVLEHIEPERLLYVLADLRRCMRKVGFFVIHTGPAAKRLADGRNTHLIQRGRLWWEKRLRKFFTVGKVIERGPELQVVVGIKATKKAVA